MRTSRSFSEILVRLRTYPATRRIFEGLRVGAACFGVIYCLAGIGQHADVILVMASFGASCVLVFTLPNSPLSQPSNVICGHLLSACAGLAAFAVFGHTPMAFACGVGGAVLLMAATSTLHPPGAGNPIIVIAGGHDWWYLATPVAAGAVFIVVAALAYHRVISGHRYPVRKVE